MDANWTYESSKHLSLRQIAFDSVIQTEIAFNFTSHTHMCADGASINKRTPELFSGSRLTAYWSQ